MAGMYDIGDLTEIAAVFTDVDGVPTDPTKVVLTVKKPDDVVSIVAATNDPDVVGRFYALLTIDQSGLWRYRFEGTGAVTAAEEQVFLVRTRRVPAPSP